MSERSPSGILATAIGRPVTVSVCAILVILFGGLSVADLPIQLTPDISVPMLEVRTRWPGGSPAEVETEILEPQEEALKSLPGLVRMTSQAAPDSGNIYLELELGTNLDEALVRASNLLGEVGSYPLAVREPRIETADSTGPAVVVLGLRAVDGRPVAAYRTWFEDSILPEIQRIKGVGNARVVGGRSSVLQIDFDPGELAARGISVPQVAARVQDELRDVSGGDVTMGRRRLLVRTMAVGASPEALEQILLGVGPDGTAIRVGDIGEASLALREATGVAYTNDAPSLVMLIDRESGSNVLELTQQIRAKAAQLDRERFRPEGLIFEVVSDQVDYIEGSLDTVRDNLIAGGILAVLALYLFLRALLPSLLVGVAIPICGFATVLVMSLTGRSVNIVSLAGITFAVGMVLDNSIVALEAVDVQRSRMGDSRRAALLGISEVWGALIASTATTAAVFVPVVGWQGEVGQLLRDVALAISAAVTSSLFVSVFVIPALAARLPPKQEPKPDAFTRGLARFTASVGGVVERLARSRWRSLGVVLVAVAASVGVSYLLLPPLEYLPAGNRNLVYSSLVPPPGTSVGEVERVADEVQRTIAREGDGQHPGVPHVARSFFVGGPDRLFAGAVAEDPEKVQEVARWVRGVQSSVPGFSAFTFQASIFGRSGGGRSIELDLQGADLGLLIETGVAAQREIAAALPRAQIQPEPSLDPGALELRAIPRRGPAAPLSPSTSALGLTIDAMIDGAIIGELGQEGEPQVDVVLRAASRRGELIETPETIASVPVVSGSGEVVPLGVLADFEEVLGPTVIRRIERQRAITLEIGPDDDMPLETALDIVRGVVAKMEADGTIPGEVQVGISGTAGDLETARVQFAGVLVLAVIICYLLMSALFENFLAPVVILVTLPLAAGGGFLALFLVNTFLAPQPLDLMTALGFLILIGVVVNNAILVVEVAIDQLRGEASVAEALRAGVESRIRPILMTTITTVAGLLPMVLVPGAGSELYRGIGAILLGGLLSSTVLTLVVVPALFAVVWPRKRAAA